VTIQASRIARPQRTIVLIALFGISIGVAAALSIGIVRPVMLAFVFGGFVLLLPAMIVREPITYWQFLFVLSFLVGVSKRLTSWLVAAPDLYYEFGIPPSGTLSVDLYISDIILILMLIPWIGQLCRRRVSFYFPSIAYIFLLYSTVALIGALLEAVSFYLAIFEWCREMLYFLSFVYIINNVVTRSHVRAIVLALIVGLVVASGSIIGSFALSIKPGNIFAGVYQERTQSFDTKKNAAEESAEVEHQDESGPHKRSSGIFVHPAHAAYYLEYILPIVLGYLLTSSGLRDRLLWGSLFGLGCIATYLTFSRAGLIGLFVGIMFFFPVAGWSGVISRRAVARWLFILVTLVAAASPLLIYSLWTRSETIAKRMELNQRGLATFWERPILGGGLNNSSAVMTGTHDISTNSEGSLIKTEVVHNYYILVLIEVGLVGFLLFFGFFGRAVVIAIRHLREAEPESKLLLVGLVSGLTGVAVHNLGDPFGAPAAVAMLWLCTGLLIAICRRVRAARPLPPRA
jgi:hypothetical protein